MGEVEEAAEADRGGVRFSISEQLTDKIRKCRGKRIKIIARVPRKRNEATREFSLNSAKLRLHGTAASNRNAKEPWLSRGARR